ncbi:copper resistance CopC/CopD family protein [Streptomyces griseosporeus]|uniref:copper resistance CopC/CopD family protein n=1 Tax=Streptomyces griseosporeus TaxID=1910 RepID=UPI0037AA7C2E
MLLGTLLVLFLLGGAAPASAHAALRATDPADGTVLRTAPRALTLTFTESVGLLDGSFRVYDPDGHRLRTGPPGHADGRADTARVTLPGTLGRGTYTVAWRVVSADSHPVSGAFTFSVGAPSPAVAAPATAPAEDPATSTLFDLARYTAYGGAALLIGTAVFLGVCRPPDTAEPVLRRVARTGWWLLLAATTALLLLRAPYETGEGPSAALDPGGLARTLTTRPGQALAARLALLGAVALLPRRPRALRTAGPVLAVALALTWASAEHASAGPQVPVAMASAVLHLLAMAVWLGGLVCLLTLLHPARPVPAAVPARFSRLALACVAVLAVTGVYQSWRGLGSWPALTGTAYGRILLAKLAAVALLLTVAALSRGWTARLASSADAVAAETRGSVAPEEHQERAAPADAVPEEHPEPELTTAGSRARREGDAPGGARRARPAEPAAHRGPTPPGAPPAQGRRPAAATALRRSVVAETLIGVLVLVITTVLTTTLPGRAEAEAAATSAPAPAGALPGASVTRVPFAVAGARGTVQVTLTPGRTGDNAVEAVVYGPDGGFATVPELRISFTLPDRQLGPLDARVTDRGGYWAADAVTLPLPGTWTMKVTVRVSEVDQVSVTRPVRVAP